MKTFLGSFTLTLLTLVARAVFAGELDVILENTVLLRLNAADQEFVSNLDYLPNGTILDNGDYVLTARALTLS